jgi:hypothetical protein
LTAKVLVESADLGTPVRIRTSTDVRDRIRYRSGSDTVSDPRGLSRRGSGRHADDQLAEVAPLEQAHERPGALLEAVDDVLAELETARHDERPHSCANAGARSAWSLTMNP